MNITQIQKETKTLIEAIKELNILTKQLKQLPPTECWCVLYARHAPKWCFSELELENERNTFPSLEATVYRYVLTEVVDDVKTENQQEIKP